MKNILAWISAALFTFAAATELAVAGEYVWTSNGPYGGAIAALAIDPQNPMTIYAGTHFAGIFKSTNGGGKWLPLMGSPGVVNAIAIDPQNPTTLYAGTHPPGPGIYKSIDGGNFWSPLNTGLDGVSVWHLVIDPSHYQTVYAGTALGVLKSIDGGNSWGFINTGLPLNIVVRVLAIDPQSPMTVYAGAWDPQTLVGGLYKSINGGSSWDTTMPGSEAVSALAISPWGRIYAGCGSGVLMSTNGGGSWVPFNTGFTNNLNVQTLVIDPSNPHQTIFAGIQGGGGVFKSVDGGDWVAKNTGLTSKNVQALAIPTSGTAPGTIYMGTFYGGGIYKSTNGGDNWSEADTELTAASVHSLAIDPLYSNTIYAGTSAGVFKSMNLGSSWLAISRDQISGSVQALVIHDYRLNR